MSAVISPCSNTDVRTVQLRCFIKVCFNCRCTEAWDVTAPAHIKSAPFLWIALQARFKAVCPESGQLKTFDICKDAIWSFHQPWSKCSVHYITLRILNFKYDCSLNSCADYFINERVNCILRVIFISLTAQTSSSVTPPILFPASSPCCSQQKQTYVLPYMHRLQTLSSAYTRVLKPQQKSRRMFNTCYS